MRKQEFIHKMAYGDLTDEQVRKEYNRHYRAKGETIYKFTTDVCLASCATAARDAEKRIKRIA